MPSNNTSLSISERIEKLLETPHVQENRWAYQQFLPDILRYYRKKGRLTSKQMFHLEKIEKQYDEEAIKALDEQNLVWREEYKTKWKIIVEYAARYYKMLNSRERTHYWEKAVDLILTDADYVPSERNCKGMTSHPRFRRSWDEWNKDPKYPVGSRVCLRKNHQRTSRFKDTEFAFVMKVDVEPAHGADGGKKYLILPNNKLEGIVIQERFLKKHRG